MDLLKKIPAIHYLLAVITLVVASFAYTWVWTGEDGKGSERIIYSDGYGYYQYLPNTFIHHNLDDQTVDQRYIFETANARAVNKYFVGTAVLMAPFFFVGWAVAAFSGFPVDGWSPPFQLSIALAGLFYLYLGLWCVCRLLKKLQFSEVNSLISIVMLALATHLFAYSAAMPSMSHVYSFFAVNITLLGWVKLIETKTQKYLFWVAVGLATVILIRPTNGLIVLAFPMISGSWEKFWNTVQTICINYKPLGVAALIFLGILFLQPLMWYWQTDRFWVTSYNNEGFYWSKPEIVNVLLSFRKGLFVYTPIAGLSFLSILVLRSSQIRLNYLLFFLPFVYVTASWWCWYYGPSFSQRPFVEVLFVLLFPLFLLVESISRIKKVGVLLVCFCLAVLNIFQTYQYQNQIISHWDMSWKKYKWAWGKMGDSNKNQLGGCRDILLYNAQLLPVQQGGLTANGKVSNMSLDQRSFDATTGSWGNQSAMYAYLVSHTFEENEVNDRGMFLHVDCVVADNEIGASNANYIMLQLWNLKREVYWSQSFKINEVPVIGKSEQTEHSYQFEIPPIYQAGEELRVFFYNPEKKGLSVKQLNYTLQLVK